MTRAFIIGNGDSLDWTPMDDLIGETTFAMNRIHLLWDRKRLIWRPTYYLGMDWIGDTMPEDFRIGAQASEYAFTRFDRSLMAKELLEDFEWPSKVSFITPCGEHVATNIATPRKPDAWHLPHICCFASTLGMAIQVAVMMDYNPLYLLGCDLGFEPEPRVGPGVNHFDPRYKTYDDFPLEERDETLIHMHEIAQRECDARGVKIYNATLGGILEVHERVDLQEVLSGSSI